jgi:hypothetical protein
MGRIAEQIAGYGYGGPEIEKSPVSLRDLDELRVTIGFTHADEDALRLAGEVLADQTESIVNHWRSGIIAGIPNLARHSRSPEGEPLPEYLAASNLRFRQWILDTCTRPYDQQWLDYQNEIALRHTSLKKNAVDGVRSTPHVPLRDIVAFIPVMNETIRPYLAAKGHGADEVEAMHRAWVKSLQLQVAIWARTYMGLDRPQDEW